MNKLLLIVFFLMFTLQVEAALPATDRTLSEAIAYGKSYQNDKSNAEMLKPWVIKENFKTNPYREDERIIVYTPYLLTALDVLEKSPEDTSVNIESAKELVDRYDGVLVIRAIINTPIILKNKDLEVVLVQQGNFVKPYHSDYLDGQYLEKSVTNQNVDVQIQNKLERMETIQEKAAALQKQLDDLKNNKIKPSDVDLTKEEPKPKTKATEVKQKICQLQYNFYFDQTEFNIKKPYLLLIKDAYCGGREFSVDPSLIK